MKLYWARLPTKRAALRAFVVSIGLTALLGIWALLAGDFGELQIKVLLSSLSVSAASLCAMAGAALLESRAMRLPALPAILLAVVGLTLVLAGLWSERASVDYWKATATICFFAVGCAHASLLLLARLGPRYAWLGWTTLVLVLLLAAYGSMLVLTESDSADSMRLLGVLSILVTAGTIATPVLHRLSRDDVAVSDDDRAADRRDMLCPACGARFRAALGGVCCARCGVRFRIELEAPDSPS